MGKSCRGAPPGIGPAKPTLDRILNSDQRGGKPLHGFDYLESINRWEEDHNNELKQQQQKKEEEKEGEETGGCTALVCNVKLA